jgi:Tfp pilus assembly protein PilN
MKDINLIPKEYSARRKRPVRLFYVIVLTALAIFSMLYLYLAPQKTIWSLEQEIKSYDDTVVDYNILKNKLAQLEKNEETINKRLQVIESISSEEVNPTEVIDFIKEALPQDVLLTNLSYSSTDVSLTCVAETAAGITEFYTELGKSDKFHNFTLSPIAKDDKGYNFTIQFSMAAGGDKDEKN